jgi:hypothetical protein
MSGGARRPLSTAEKKRVRIALAPRKLRAMPPAMALAKTR